MNKFNLSVSDIDSIMHGIGVVHRTINGRDVVLKTRNGPTTLLLNKCSDADFMSLYNAAPKEASLAFS